MEQVFVNRFFSASYIVDAVILSTKQSQEAARLLYPALNIFPFFSSSPFLGVAFRFSAVAILSSHTGLLTS